MVHTGSLSASYDIDHVIEALKKARTDLSIKFLVMENGSLESGFEAHAWGKADAKMEEAVGGRIL